MPDRARQCAVRHLARSLGCLFWLSSASSFLSAAPEHPLDAAAGKALFERNWVSAPSSTAASDGLGPFYDQRSCAGCHPAGGAGPTPQTLILRSADPVYGLQLQRRALPGLEPEAVIGLSYPASEIPGTARAGHRLHIEFTKLRYGPLASPVSARRPPTLQGLALLEQVDEAALLALADPGDADGDGISGRPAWLDSGDGPRRMGRFGWKAESPDLETQIAVALSLDIGLGSPLLPSSWGDCSEVQHDCLAQAPGTLSGPAETEVDSQVTALLLSYLRALPPPRSGPHEGPGAALFDGLGCARCHLPRLQAGESTIRPYTDLLLHDMGPGLAAGPEPGAARMQEWRTPPLWGLSDSERLLHDGRAENVEAAVLWHAGEAETAREAYRQLNPEQKRHLLDFLNAL